MFICILYNIMNHQAKSQIFFRVGSFVILILNWGLIRGAYAKIYFGLTSRRLLIHLVAICNDNFSLRTRQATRSKRKKYVHLHS